MTAQNCKLPSVKKVLGVIKKPGQDPDTIMVEPELGPMRKALQAGLLELAFRVDDIDFWVDEFVCPG